MIRGANWILRKTLLLAEMWWIFRHEICNLFEKHCDCMWKHYDSIMKTLCYTVCAWLWRVKWFVYCQLFQLHEKGVLYIWDTSALIQCLSCMLYTADWGHWTQSVKFGLFGLWIVFSKSLIYFLLANLFWRLNQFFHSTLFLGGFRRIRRYHQTQWDFLKNLKENWNLTTSIVIFLY